jgi:esterase/lipase
MIKVLFYCLSRSVFLLIILALTIYFIRAYDSLSTMQLRDEHRIEFENEFRADMERSFTWEDYLALEKSLKTELDEKLDEKSNRNILSRHSAHSKLNPGNINSKWNYSYRLEPSEVKGSAVLIHGLSDSPYSMRSTAEIFRDNGLVSFVPRMPGHGFAVGGLRQVSWQDWSSVVRIAMREADQRRKPGQPLILSGYSNGALLAIHYALECQNNDELVCPDGLLLFSSAISVTPFARFADWHSFLSWLTYFEQFQWESIAPEIDPYKFTSFPKNPGREIFELTHTVNKKINKLNKSDRSFPRVISFQSIVDDTVDAKSILNFISKLPGKNHEVVVYDVNQNEAIVEILKKKPDNLIEIMNKESPFEFKISLITNRSQGSDLMRLVELDANSRELIDSDQKFEWPDEIYSLSHIAIPFPPTDMVYGSGITNDNFNFGKLAPRGERKMLNLEPSYFLRLRYNPFYSFQEQKIKEWLDNFIKSN